MTAELWSWYEIPGSNILWFIADESLNGIRPANKEAAAEDLSHRAGTTLQSQITSPGSKPADGNQLRGQEQDYGAKETPASVQFSGKFSPNSGIPDMGRNAVASQQADNTSTDAANKTSQAASQQSQSPATSPSKGSIRDVASTDKDAGSLSASEELIGGSIPPGLNVERLEEQDLPGPWHQSRNASPELRYRLPGQRSDGTKESSGEPAEDSKTVQAIGRTQASSSDSDESASTSGRIFFAEGWQGYSSLSA